MKTTSEAECACGGPGEAGVVGSLTEHTGSASAVDQESGISAKLDEHTRLLMENSRKLTDLQEQLAKCQNTIEQKTYANVVASKSPQQVTLLAFSE
ncbi:unnamed protein product, partial [Brenthis ino]